MYIYVPAYIFYICSRCVYAVLSLLISHSNEHYICNYPAGAAVNERSASFIATYQRTTKHSHTYKCVSAVLGAVYASLSTPLQNSNGAIVAISFSTPSQLHEMF